MTGPDAPWRPLEARDIPAAVDLVNAEGWTFTTEDFERLLHLGGGVVAEDADGAILGLLTLVMHAEQAWIGNVVVAPEARGRGTGAVLVEGALARARAADVPVVGLYSVLPAVTLYERAGFKPQGEVVSLLGRAHPGGPVPGGVRALGPVDLAAMRELDARAAGTDRGRMLDALHAAFPEHTLAYAPRGDLRGFVVSKPSPSGAEIGPLVTRDPEDEEAIAALVDAALARLPPGDVEAGVHRANATALRVLKARGFTESFPALTMYHGDGHAVDGRLEACVAGMEKG